MAFRLLPELSIRALPSCIKAKGLFGLLDMSNIYYSLALEGQSLGI